MHAPDSLSRDDRVDRYVEHVRRDPVTVSSADEQTAENAARLLASAGFVVLRRPARLSVGGLDVDVQRHEVRWRGRTVELSPREFRVLTTLAEFAGRVVEPDELLRAAWGPEYVGSLEYVKPVISRLRRMPDGTLGPASADIPVGEEYP